MDTSALLNSRRFATENRRLRAGGDISFEARILHASTYPHLNARSYLVFSNLCGDTADMHDMPLFVSHNVLANSLIVWNENRPRQYVVHQPQKASRKVPIAFAIL